MSDKLNLIQTLEKTDMFSIFTRLMASSGTNDLISAPGTYTVFAPTNDAFSKIPDAKLDELTNETNQTKLKALLSYHILPGKIMAASLVSAPNRKAFTGEELMFTDVSGLKVNSAGIQARNLEATNGVIHALDTVLTPTMVPRAGAASAAIAASLLAAVPSAPASAIPATATTPLASPVLSAVPPTVSVLPAITDTKSVL
jgi:uncharacterized surface protein with fasciclin (FAS1) repeats